VTNNGDGVIEILGERGTKAAMFAMTVPARGQDPNGDKPTLTFRRDETKYRLTSIWASGTDGRTITGK
jgi:alkylation response protein AidB-like acyl-CoA dehydrogenase